MTCLQTKNICCLHICHFQWKCNSLNYSQSFESFAIDNPLIEFTIVCFVLFCFLFFSVFWSFIRMNAKLFLLSMENEQNNINGWCAKRWTVKWTMAWNRINAYPNRMNLINVIKLAGFHYIIAVGREKILCVSCMSGERKKQNDLAMLSMTSNSI